MLSKFFNKLKKIILFLIFFSLAIFLGDAVVHLTNSKLLLESEIFYSRFFNNIYFFNPTADDPFETNLQPHPIWSLTNGQKNTNNNYGFKSEINYPPQITSNKQIRIGLFGASVAEQEFPILKNAIDELPEVINLKKQNIDVNIFNFSIVSARQPQQLMTLIHFSDNIDIAINLDGHNEIINDGGRQYPVEFPMNTHELYFLNKKKFDKRHGLLTKKKWQILFLSPLQQFNILKKSSLYFLTMKYVFNLLEEYYPDFNKALDEDSPKILSSIPSPEQRLTERINYWKKYTLLQKQIADIYNIKSIFFIQPSPTVKDSKILSSDEVKILMNLTPEAIASNSNQFANLKQAGLELSNRGVNVVDLTQVFKTEANSVYIDSCCHLNELGKKILAKELAASLRPLINEMAAK